MAFRVKYTSNGDYENWFSFDKQYAIYKFMRLYQLNLMKILNGALDLEDQKFLDVTIYFHLFLSIKISTQNGASRHCYQVLYLEDTI